MSAPELANSCCSTSRARRTTAAAVLLAAGCLALISSRPVSAELQDLPRYTCRNHSQCQQRLHRFGMRPWVCCLTVLCNAKYGAGGGYYILHSGCASLTHCQPEAILNGDRYSGRFYMDKWEEKEREAYEDCSRTMALFSPDAVSRMTAPVAGGTSFTLAPEPSCSQLPCEQCCHKFRCSIRRFQHTVECRPNCRAHCTANCRLRDSYDFFFPEKDWQRRAEYRKENLAPDPTQSCTELRFFYFWIRSGSRQRRKLSLT